MILSILIIIVIALAAFWWGNQGAFSGLLHMLCALVAGAVAFAAWEPLAYMLLNAGGLPKFIPQFAWGLGLAVPFILSFVILRVLCDSLIKSNLTLPKGAELGIGGVCGAVSGIVSTGICVIAFGHMQVPGDIMGFYGVKRDRGGQLKTRNSLLVPVHSITAGLYNTLSTGAFATAKPLAEWSPELDRNTTLFHDTVDGGKGAVSMPTNAVKFTGDLHRVQAGPTGESLVVGLEFTSKAMDHGNRLTITNSQVRLVSNQGEVQHPEGWFSQWGSAEGQGYFMYDADTNVASSEPGTSGATFHFAFPVKAGFAPRFVQVKGVRIDLRGQEEAPISSTLAAYYAKSTGALAAAGPFEIRDISRSVDVTKRFNDIRAGKNALPAGFTVNSDNEIVSGNGILQLGGKRPPRKLRIQGLAEISGARMVAINVSRGEPACLFDAKPAGPDSVRLLTDPAATYSPVGYIFKDRRGLQINLDPAGRFPTVDDLPALPSSGSQELTLLFYVTEGATVTGLKVGEQTIGTCLVPVTAKN